MHRPARIRDYHSMIQVLMSWTDSLGANTKPLCISSAQAVPILDSRGRLAFQVDSLQSAGVS
jgi:hypothetical protein